MKENGTTYYCCKTCGFGKKGQWVNTHKPEDCFCKAKKEENAGESTDKVAKGNIVLEMIEGISSLLFHSLAACF